MSQTQIHRILIVDDNKAIHEDLRKVLGADETTALDIAEAKMFDDAAPVSGEVYELDFACQGQEALAKVSAAVEAGRPFSMAFVDMRMPPGWDGVETIAHIWKKDPDIQIVICTAYSDYSWEQILQKLGRSDRLLILKKPFDTVEACQLACALTRKWSLAREAGVKKAELERMVRERTAELANANEELHRTNQQLHVFYGIESERNHLRDSVRAMDQVLGIIGHELRTPLGCIRGLSDVMLTKVGAADSVALKMLGGINKTAQEMASTLETLLEAARLNSGLAVWNWSTFPLNSICDDAFREVWPSPSETSLQLVQKIDPDELTMAGDRDAVRRLLLNLLSNAQKHTTSGQVAISIRQAVENTGNWVEIQVSDTGAGMPPEIVARLGEPFALNRGVIGECFVNGAGLGIAICKTIAEAHGGTIQFQSTVGAGTTVVVRLRQDLAEPIQSRRVDANGRPSSESVRKCA